MTDSINPKTPFQEEKDFLLDTYRIVKGDAKALTGDVRKRAKASAYFIFMPFESVLIFCVGSRENISMYRLKSCSDHSVYADEIMLFISAKERMRSF